LARALRERRPPDQERTKPGDQKSPHIGAALPAANEQCFDQARGEVEVWEARTKGPAKQYPDRTVKRYAAVILKALNGPIPSSGVRTLWKTVAIRGGIMRKTLTALLAAITLGVAALPSTAEARWGWGWGGFGVGPGRRSNHRRSARASVLSILRLWVRLRLPGLLSGMLPGILPRVLRLLWRPAILRLPSLLAPSLLASSLLVLSAALTVRLA